MQRLAICELIFRQPHFFQELRMRTFLIAVVVGAGIAGCELKAQERRPVPEEILKKNKL